MTLNKRGVECKVASPCPRCESGAPHPPILMTYDPATGGYVESAARTCMAHWIMKGADHAAGDICSRTAERKVGDLYVCWYHGERADKWAHDLTRMIVTAEIDREKALHEERLRHSKEYHDEYLRQERAEEALKRELARERIRTMELTRAESCLIYYAQRGDGMIKIGTTRKLAKRLVQHKRDFGPLRLLATHGGSYPQETALHGDFNSFRVTPRGEWFRPELELMRHILKVRRDYEVATGPKLPPVMELEELKDIVRALGRQAKSVAA